MNPLVIFYFLLISIISNTSEPDSWSQFRGNHGNGVSSASNLPIEWGMDQNLKWMAEVPGKGWSSPIIWENKVFITTAYPAARNNDSETGEEASANQGGQRIMPDKDYRFEVYCLDKITGQIIWRDLSYLGKPGIPTHFDNTYASETPATDGSHVYVYFGMVGLYCYDMNGKKIWEKDLGAFPMQSNWGTSSSPIVYEDKLFIQFDNEENSRVIALDKKTGNQIWRTERDEISTWSTPYIWKNKQRIELVTGGKKTRSYNPDTGALLWQLDMKGGRDISTPTSNADMIFVCNEERSDGGGVLFAVKAGANGDISLDGEETSNDWVAWSLPKCGIAMASPLLLDCYLYALERRRGLVSCIDATTGQFIYRKEQLEGAKAFWASPWTCDGMIFCLDDTGTTHVLQSGPEFKVLAENTLNDRFWSSTAVSTDVLVFRGVDGIYGIGK